MVGARLNSATGTFHLFGGHTSPNPIAVWLDFDSGHRYRFAGAPDGWRLLVDERPAKDVDKQELGSVRIEKLESSMVTGGINQVVRKASVLLLGATMDVVGVRLHFEGSSIVVMNWGDEMHVEAGLPEGAEAEGIKERPIG